MTVYFGTNTTEATAVMQLDSTSGGLLVPRMTTTQRDAISSPAESLLIFNTTTNSYNWYDEDGTAWREFGSSGVSSNVSADTLTLNDGSELTIASGAITVTHARHTVDTESDAASDDLDTISGLAAGEAVVLSANHTARTVVFKDGVDNIICSTGADITLDETYKLVLCVSLDGSNVHVCPLFASDTATDADAIHDNVSGEINAISEKGSPVSADLLLIEDSEDTNSKKKVQLGNLPGGGNVSTGAAITIPGLEASPDIDGAAGGGGVDREFDASGGTTFTWDTAPLSENIDTTVKSHYYIQYDNTTTGDKIGTLAWSPGSGAFDARMKAVFGTEQTGTTGLFSFGLHIGNSDNSSRLLLQQATGNMQAFTYAASTYTQRGSSHAVLMSSSGMYFRITRDGSNNCSFYYSENGILWKLIATQSLTFTVANIGVRLSVTSATDNFAAIDWLRTNV